MQSEVWLEAWSRSPQEPKACLKLIPRKSQPERREPSNFQEQKYQPSPIRVGGRPKQLLLSLEHRKLVRPCFQTATGRRPVGLPELDRIGQEAVLSKLADSTRRAYGTGWKHWELFMSGTGVSPFLSGESRQERLEDEQWLIRFVVFLHEVMGRTAQGIRQRLSAVRYAHIAAGFPDPLQGRVRLWASLQGLARWENAPLRKVPVTPLMLKWIFDYLLQGSRSQQEKAALWGSICIGWFFMLRASEYLPPPNPEHAPKRVLRGGDVVFYKEGQVSSFRDADEVALHLREAKNDQFQRGQTRAHHRTSAAICPVDALQAHARQNPVWISDPSAVVFQFQNVGVTREMVSDLLRLATVAEGHPSHLVGSHSLRKGGATAMLACTDDLEQVKRFGGWKSDAVHAYLYADHATSKTRSSDMLRSKPILSSAQRTGSQPARHRPSGVKCGGHPPTLFGGYPPVASPVVGGHPPCAKAVAEARTAKAVTNHQMKELVRSGKSAYDILGVSRDTMLTDVEKAYRRKCLKWHPDKWQTHSPEEQKKVEDTFKTASSPTGGAGVPKKAPPTAKSATRRQKQPVAHVVVTGSGSLLVNTAGMLTRKTRRLVLPDVLLEELGRMQAFLQRVQAFLAELKARPHLLPEAAALMEREGGLEQMEPLLDWVPGAGSEVFALQDGPSRPTSVDPPLARPTSTRESQRPERRCRRPHQHALPSNRRRRQLGMRAARWA